MNNALSIVLVAGLVTLAIRFAPFLFFSGRRQVPEAVRYLGRVLPPAIMGTLILLTLRQVDLFAGSRGLPEAAGILVTVVSQVTKRNTLLSIAAGTTVYMILIRLM